MSDRFPIPPEMEEMKRQITDAFEPALQQQKALQEMIAAASLSLPHVGSLKDQLPGVVHAISNRAINMDTTLFQFDKQLQSSLAWWDDQRRKLARVVQEYQENVEYAQRKLLSEDSSLKVWGMYGWTISPRASIKDYYYVPKTKEDADKYMDRIHDDKAVKKTIQLLRNSDFHSSQDIDEIVNLYNDTRYKACTLMLFSLIDSLLIHTQDETIYAANRKQGNGAIARFEKLVEPDDCQEFTTQVLSFISSTEALKAFFDETPNWQNNNPVLNRHLACHGMLQRDVNKTDCNQLMLLYENMLHCTRQI